MGSEYSLYFSYWVSLYFLPPLPTERANPSDVTGSSPWPPLPGAPIPLNHGVAQRMRLNLGNLNPMYARELIKLGVYHEVEGS